jgi:polysaccharide pyruvyl transferase WcaK-like protein
VLPPKQIYNVSLLNQFDLIIIGGGGLLSHPHDPLTSEDWQRAVDVPVVLFGIGAGGQVASKSNTLITKAIYVSGRDDSSLTALRRFRDDIRFVPDPVLADPCYYLNSSSRRKHRITDKNKLWIIKNTKNTRASQLMRFIKPEEDEICFVEPFLDFPLLEVFPSARPIYFIDDLITLIDRAALVVSTRYHGCILSILRNKPVVGLFEQKSLELFTRYDLSQFFTADGTTIPDSADFTRPSDKIIRDRDIFRTELTAVLSLLTTDTGLALSLDTHDNPIR